jgi:hypothetical protein
MLAAILSRTPSDFTGVFSLGLSSFFFFLLYLFFYSLRGIIIKYLRKFMNSLAKKQASTMQFFGSDCTFIPETDNFFITLVLTGIAVTALLIVLTHIILRTRVAP